MSCAPGCRTRFRTPVTPRSLPRASTKKYGPGGVERVAPAVSSPTAHHDSADRRDAPCSATGIGILPLLTTHVNHVFAFPLGNQGTASGRRCRATCRRRTLACTTNLAFTGQCPLIYPPIEGVRKVPARPSPVWSRPTAPLHSTASLGTVRAARTAPQSVSAGSRPASWMNCAHCCSARSRLVCRRAGRCLSLSARRSTAV